MRMVLAMVFWKVLLTFMTNESRFPANGANAARVKTVMGCFTFHTATDNDSAVPTSLVG